ncbi:MAG: hypothetical protein AB7U20_05735 [Planctomycetaceae bacterium]
MAASTRREFLDSVGRGMLVAGLGTSLAVDLGFSTAFADEGPESLSFGKYDSLIDLLQSTPPDKLQPLLVAKLTSGEANLKQLMSAGALANAEAFGGEDYVGFHTAMAMLPALQMADLLPTERRPLPVLKVLYRNSGQIQELGGESHKILRRLIGGEHPAEGNIDLQIRDAARQTDVTQAEALFATLADAPIDEMFNVLQPAMQDDINIHRFVFAYRTHGLANLLGQEYAYDILRQCVRFCVNHEQQRISHNNPESPIRALMPKLLDQYKLAGKSFGKTDPGDDWVDRTSLAIYNGPPERSAEIAAAAIAEGIDPEVIGEAISLASNLLTLRQGADQWRAHGDAQGVHSSDGTNAWRNMARVAQTRHAVSGLIIAAYHSAWYKPYATEAFPLEEHREAIRTTAAAALLAEAEDAVRHNDQGRASAAIAIYGEQGYPVQPVLDSMLKFAISEDGRLHGEKFFHTVSEEYRTIRPAFRWRQIVALARVTASAYGYSRTDEHGDRAPGYEQACQLLGVNA